MSDGVPGDEITPAGGASVLTEMLGVSAPQKGTTVETKELEVPEEVRELFDEVLACNQCRDECIRSVFKAKRAIYYAKKAVRANTDAWRKVRELWPQTADGHWKYSHDTALVSKA